MYAIYKCKEAMIHWANPFRILCQMFIVADEIKRRLP